jgi:hypothetical protein
MRFVTDPRRPPESEAPPAAGGEQRLARPPSERYRSTPAGKPPAERPPPVPPGATDRLSPGRGIAFGAIAALLGAVLIVVLGGAVAVSAGLLVVAAAVGYTVGLATAAGAGDTISKRARPWIAGALAGLGALLGQVGLWLFARAEGGVLAPIDYLGQTFGPLVPLELLLAAGVAWWRAR